MRFALAGAAFLVVTAAFHPAAAADFKLLRLAGDFVKWGSPTLGSGAEVSYALADRAYDFADARNCASVEPLEAGALGLAMETIERELAAALGAWEGVADIRFRRVETPADADILIGMQSHPEGHAFADVARADGEGTAIASAPVFVDPEPMLAGWGRAARPGTVAIGRSLVCLNPEEDWKVGFDGDTTRYDLRHTLTHEIGHAIGLDHPGATGTLMSYRYDETSRGLQAGDIAGATTLYGSSRQATTGVEKGGDRR